MTIEVSSAGWTGNPTGPGPGGSRRVYAAFRDRAALDDAQARLEEAGIMLRIDPTRTPTMARTPTLARWELELLRTVTRVVRLGHLRSVGPGRLELERGTVRTDPDAVVVHCAAAGLSARPLVPVWGDLVRLQSVGWPCFGAALAGYVEATRSDDAAKNRLCLPTPEGDGVAEWCAMQVRTSRAQAAVAAEPDVADLAARTPLNLARVAPGEESRPEVAAALERVRAAAPAASAVMRRYARAAR